MAPGILLLFEGGDRPSAQSVRDVVDNMPGISISLDPGRLPGGGYGADPGWLELLCQGLTFDLHGLLPGPAIEMPIIRHQIGFSEIRPDVRFDVLRLSPGPHLSGGERSLPIVRALTGLAAELASKLAGAEAIFWPPIGNLIGRDLFRSTVGTWVDGGAFPALVFTSMKAMPGGGIASDGLAYFTGQEIHIEADNSADNTAAKLLALRLVNQLVQHGPLTQAEAVTAPDGSQLRLEPSENGQIIRVWHG